jgi:hypothetical protein
MVFVSVTRLRLRSAFYLLPFIWRSYWSAKQIKKAQGFIKGKTLMDRKLSFWTLSLWFDEADMREYRNSGAHKKAMPQLQHWCSEASVVNWQQENDTFPGWEECYRRMTEAGRASKVKRPSPEHASLGIPTPRYPSKAEQVLLPETKTTG